MEFARLREEKLGLSTQITKTFFEGIFNDCLVGKADLYSVIPAYLQEWKWKGSVEEFYNPLAEN